MFPDALQNPRIYRPEWEAECFDLNRIYTLLAQGRWFRETSIHGEFWLGMQRYFVGLARKRTTQEITFDPTTIEFCVKTVGSDDVIRRPAKGLLKVNLIGDLPPFSRFPILQLALPFSRDIWRRNYLCQVMSGGTTL